MNELESKIKLVGTNHVKSDLAAIKSSNKSSKDIGMASDRVSLSHNSKSPSQSKELKNGNGEIRHDLVKKFRSVLQEGTYSIKADEIADKLVQNIRDNKNHLIL
ncbi:MAG: flagellar biosynthesis anti-sigma factor FlgM [Nitrospinota bacterium]|nr:flagellar biosynthesis anti-sigma factor FlgM [Nitrospinota bacterium]